MPDTIVFLGPTLPITEARAILDAEYHPPARMGDVYRLLSQRVRRIVLIDGVFHGVPSVWHRELVDALVEGVEVIGASSMGALRAAELAPHGMRGVGSVFEWYRDGVIDGDDEVTLVHGEADMDFRPLSMPLVNVRATLRDLAARGVIKAGEHDAILAWFKSQPYPARSLRTMESCPTIHAWPEVRVAAVLHAIREHFVDIKREDAKAALQFAASTPPSGKLRPLPDADRTERAMWRIGRSLRGTLPIDGDRVPGQSLVASLSHEERHAIERALARQAFLVAWARLRNADPAPATRTRRDDTWLDARGLTAAMHDRLIDEQHVAEWLCATGPAAFGLPATDDPAHAFIADWAREHGIVIVGEDSDAALASWMIEQGPAHFGLPFYSDAAIADHLRLKEHA